MAYTADLTSPATGDAAMRRFKNQLVSAGWTVPSSSDGATYNTSGDQITTDSGAGSLATQGAWMRLRMPGSGAGGAGTYRELLFQRGSTSLLWRVLYSAIGFTVATSATATRVPVATDEQPLLGAGTAASPTYAQLLPTEGTYRLLVCAEDAAPYYVGLVTFPYGGGTPQAGLFLWPMRSGSYPSADVDPYVTLADYGVPPCTRSRLLSVSVGAKAWSRYGLSSSAFDYCQLAAPQAVIDPVNNSIVHPITGEEFPIEIPALVIGSGPVVRGPKGYVRDARYVLTPTAATPYGTHLSYASRHWIRVGDLWVPWGVTAPAL